MSGPVVLWTSPTTILALDIVDDDLVRRDSRDGGETWSAGAVIARGITGFAATQRPPEEDDRIRVLTWVDYMRDRSLGVFFIDPVR